MMDPAHAAGEFIRRASLAMNGRARAAGQLAQDVQRSGFPLRYDQVAQQAYGMLSKFCGERS